MNDDALRDDQLKAPPRLVEAFRRASSERIFVPPTIDETIFKAAERHLSPGPRRVRQVWWWKSLATALALLAALVLVTDQWRRSASSQFSREDINHDGKIDILDAFELARQVRQGSSADKRLDLNGDGVVDEKDVATIAAHAVKLERGGRS